MTNQEALHKLEVAKDLYVWDAEDLETVNLAIAALRKQIPKKPTQVEPCNNGTRFGWRPSCPTSQVCETANYCKTCGQALDWAEGERRKGCTKREIL